MPHFTLQMTPAGPIVDAFVGVSAARQAALQAAGQQVPMPVRIRALVDTGASATCIDPSVPVALGLTPTGNISMTTPSTGTTPHSADVYDVALLIPGPTFPPLTLPTIPVAAVDLLQAQGFHALIGRDILGACVFHYNGAVGTFTLAF